ncbi:MAG: hypothetical protein HEQ23_08270 [Tepidisphaera sp.]
MRTNHLINASILASLALASGAAASITIGASAVRFVDISTTGTSIGTLTDDSETTVAAAAHGWIGNGLFSGGRSFRVGNNGGILWGSSATDTFTGADQIGYYNAGPLNSDGQTSIASLSASNSAQAGNGAGLRQFIAVLWDDYFPSAAGGTNIRYQVINNDLIVQWTNQDHFAAQGAGFVTFQAIFRGGVALDSGQSLVDFVYQDTLYQTNQYQNDGGSATIGYKNWNLLAGANDVEYGIGGGGNSAFGDPTFADGTGRQAKVSGWAQGGDSSLTHSVSIIGVPTPGTAALLTLGGLVAYRRRRK